MHKKKFSDTNLQGDNNGTKCGDIIEVMSGRYFKRGVTQRGKVIKVTAQMIEVELNPVATTARGPVRTTRLMQSCVRKVRSTLPQVVAQSSPERDGYEEGEKVEIIGGKYFSEEKTRYATVMKETDWMVKVKLHWVKAGEVEAPTLMKGNIKRIDSVEVGGSPSESGSEESSDSDSVTLVPDTIGGEQSREKLPPSVELTLLSLAERAVSSGVSPQRLCDELRDAMCRFQMEVAGHKLKN